jgi:PKD domain
MLSHKLIPIRCFLVAILLVMIGGLFTPAPVGQAQLTGTCPLEQGYWKDHPEAWPRPTLVLGNPNNTAHTYTQSELLALLKLSTQGDASIILARQLIAAKLNVFNGTNPAPIASTLSQADGLFASFPGKLPYGVRTNTALGKSMTATALILENYNAGRLPDSCGSDNIPPLANAGPDQTVFLGDTVHLDGSASSDPDGDPLTYSWSFISRPQGSQAALSDPNAVKPTFAVDQPGTYEIRLVVNDGTVDSPPDTVVISTQNSKPIADAGPDQTVPLGSRVFLDGRGSRDADGDALTFRWQLLGRPANSNAVLQNASTAQPSFIADRAGNYTVELIVNDGKLDSDPDIVIISTQNSKPVANAGPDQLVSVGATVQLDGSGSTDADGVCWATSGLLPANRREARLTFLVHPKSIPHLSQISRVSTWSSSLSAMANSIATPILRASPFKSCRRSTTRQLLRTIPLRRR